MKKIILSLSMIAVVAVVVMGATGAFFSDTETSTGNTFTAGAIDLTVDSTQHYNNAVCVNNLWALEPSATATNPQYPVIGSACGGTWALKDLAPTSDKFFNFADIKPGDSGEDTISLHVLNNDAWMCANVANLTDLDNTCTGPEGKAEMKNPDGTTSSTPGCSTVGELSQAMTWKVWKDDGGTGSGTACDNIQNGDEQTLASGHPTDGTLALYDSTTGHGPLTGTSTSCLGVAWSLPASSGNETQTDSMTGDISFNVVQSRNNGQFVCGQSQTVRPTVGALLSAYVAPTCTTTVQSGGSIQTAIDNAVTNSTVCVAAGTYNQDVLINKSITLAGAGQTTTIINGQTGNQGAAVRIAANNVTVEGFQINGAGTGAIRFSANVSGATVAYNKITSASGQTAVDTEGSQSNHTFSNNEFVGNSAGQLVYVNGAASLGVANASTNVDFTNNTFSGTIAAGGEALGNEAGSSAITKNVFRSTLTSTYTILEAWQNNILVNENNFDGAGGVKVTRSTNVNTISDTTNAENNWWGAAAPSGHTSGLVDSTLPEASAFAEN